MSQLVYLIKHHALKFGGIGVLNTLFQQVCYLTFIFLSIPYAFAQVISFLLALALSFVLNCKFNYHVPLTLKTAFKFTLANLPSLILQAIALILLVQICQIPEKVALILTLFITVPTSFLLISKGLLNANTFPAKE